MGVSGAQILHAEQVGDPALAAGGKNQGTLKTEGKDYSFFVLADSEAVTEAVSEFLQEINQQKTASDVLLDFEFLHITQQLIETEHEKTLLLGELLEGEQLPEQQGSAQKETKMEGGRQTQHNQGAHPKNSSPQAPSKSAEVVYTSLFSLARSFHTSKAQQHHASKSEGTHSERNTGREEHRPVLTPMTSQKSENEITKENRYDRERQGEKQREREKEDEREGAAQDQQQHQQESGSKEDKSKKKIQIHSIQAARSKSGREGNSAMQRPQAATQSNQNPGSYKSGGSVDSIYIRFMALMARILGQAEYEAHQLYLRIKERTDNIDVLTLLVSKVNSEKGAIDWSNNQEMKQLIDRARAIGVDIPQGKYSWSEEEKKLLKENIQMRKDSMEKMTQLERTDMQRFLQEASQCHQARSNVLKLLKEVVDTILANLRP